MATLPNAPAPFPVKRLSIDRSGNADVDGLATKLSVALDPVLLQLSGIPASGDVIAVAVAPGWTAGNGLGYIQGLNGVTMLQGTVTYAASAHTLKAVILPRNLAPKFQRRFVVSGVGGSGEALLATLDVTGGITVTKMDTTSAPTNDGEVVSLDGVMFVAGN